MILTKGVQHKGHTLAILAIFQRHHRYVTDQNKIFPHLSYNDKFPNDRRVKNRIVPNFQLYSFPAHIRT